MKKTISKSERTIKSILHDGDLVCDWRFCDFYDCDTDECLHDWMVRESPGEECPLFGRGESEDKVCIEMSYDMPELYKVVEVVDIKTGECALYKTEKYPEGFVNLKNETAIGIVAEQRQMHPEKYIYIEPMNIKND